MKVKFFDLARKVSKLSDHPRFNLGSVIVSGNKIISVGANKLRTHPRSKHPFHSLHSEMMAIIYAKQDLSDCDIYVYRETKGGVPAMSKSCIYCQEMVREAGIKNIYYSTSNGYQLLRV